ncbi:MAG TPA: LytTR family DNA-binding domain-containing protein [Cyclobacteriaceae bacterium]|nr:LytTR family DNA-binding domain-containing protein [Cyclobacteriaceae bacterium]
MNSLSCMIVDDEPLSQDVLKKYIGDIPGLRLTACCFNALDAAQALRESPVDLIFLDINMPKLSGINLLKSMDNPPMVIFTTAYPQYAVEGFDLDAVDYLLKPISFERFMKAVNKAFEQNSRNSETKSSFSEGFMTIKSDKKFFKINFSDILFFQAYGDFVKVHLTDKVLVTAGTLKNLEQILPPQFMRVHKSYILSIQRIKYIEGNRVFIEQSEIPLGPGMRDILLNRMDPSKEKGNE